jgi:DNA-directed RNA polymerase specialized sigma24 family protein
MLDPALRGFVEAPDDGQAERCLAALLDEQAAPLMRRIAARKLRAYAGGAGHTVSMADLDDIIGDALLALLSRLQSLRADPDSDPIASFDDYTATVTYNTFAQYLRRRHPERSRLKNRLRYVLTRDGRFGLWQTPEGLVCGLASESPRPASAAATETMDRMAAEPQEWLRWTARRQEASDDPAAITAAVLRAIGGPVEFDRLVGTIAALCVDPRKGIAQDPSGPLPDRPSPSADVALDQRRFTERLWGEICGLPLRQRVALLLNLCDRRAGGVLWVLPLTGVASIRGIARALEIPDLEMAELWNRLPLDDLAIADRLACTRQQVINLRSAARKRLAHRLASSAGGREVAASTNMKPVSTSLGDKA